MNIDFYCLTTVGDRGQVCLPLEARKEFNIKSGDYVSIMFIEKINSLIILKEKISESHHEVYNNNKVQKSGQIVLPKELREKHEIKTGDKFLVVKKHACGLLLLNFKSMQEKLTSMLNKLKELDK